MVKNVLFINLGGIGDEIMFLPALISFKKEFPDSKITLALEKRSASIAELTNVIDEMIFVDKTKLGMLKLLFRMQIGRFDIVISSGSNKLISVLLFLSGIKNRIGYATNSLSYKLLTYPVELNKNQYAVNMYHSLVSPLTEQKTDLPVFDIVGEPKIPNSVLIHPGVSKKSIEQGCIKTITPNDWALLVKGLAKAGKKIILTGGKDDSDTISQIKSALEGVEYLDFSSKTKNLIDLAKLISSAEIFVCSDSAPLHIAVGMNTKTFTFFGSTDYTKLIPKKGCVTPLINDFECPLRPCLWERRSKSCEDLGCLKFEVIMLVRL